MRRVPQASKIYGEEKDMKRERISAGLLIIALALLWAPAVQAAKVVQVALVISDDHPVFNEIIEGIPALQGVRFDFYHMRGNRAAAKDIIDKINTSTPAVVVTVGPLATGSVAPAVHPIPVVFCGVTNPAGLLADQKVNATGVELNPKMMDQLKALVDIVKPKSVGVLFTNRSKALVDEAEVWLKAHNIRLVSRRIDSPDGAEKALDKLKKEGIEALWMMPDKMNLSRRVFETMIAFSSENSVPVYGLTPKLVSLGALFTLASDYKAMGSQVGSQLKKIIRKKQSPGNLPVESPGTMKLFFNVDMAEDLDVKEIVLKRLLGFSASTGYPIIAVVTQ